MTSLAERVAQPDMVGLPEWQVAELLNAPDASLPPKRQEVRTEDAREILLGSQFLEWFAIEQAAAASDKPLEVRAVASIMMKTLTTTTVIRMQIPTIYDRTAQSLAALVQANLLKSQTRDALMALAERAQSWAEHHEIEVTPRSVSLARKGE